MIENEYPYDSAEHAFFSAMQVAKIKAAGGRPKSSGIKRPGDSRDVEIVIKRLFQNRILLPDHIRVLRWYGRREDKPDQHNEKEAKAFILWTEAMDLIGHELKKKGVINGEFTNR